MPPTSSSTDKRAIESVLENLRSRIRTYVLTEAGLLVLLLAGVAFWVGLATDWFFEPPPSVRIAAYAILALSALVILLWWGVNRWFANLSDRSLALLLERKFPELNDRLSVAVDLSNRPAGDPQVHAELAERTLQGAAEATRQIDPALALNQPRLRRFMGGAAALLLSVLALAMLAPKVWQTYSHRLALSPEKWPRSVELTLDGFQPDGRGGWVRKVARNSDVPIVVRPNLTGELKSPGRVSIRYRWQDGGRGRDELVRIGGASAAATASQRFEYLFERIAGEVEFSLRGGDARIEPVRIEVVERPKVTALTFECTYPDYLDRSARSLTAGPRMELPEGTSIRVTGVANKPLREIRWQTSTDQGNQTPAVNRNTSSEFAYDLQLTSSDVDLQIRLLDEDGIESAEAFKVAVLAKRDLKPQIQVVREGIGTAVTPTASIPLQLSIEDDYAVQSATLAVKRDEQTLATLPVALPSSAGQEIVTLASTDLREVSKAIDSQDPAAENPDAPAQGPLEPGQRLSIAITAKDYYDLNEQPRISAAPPMTFEIVTPEELLARLSVREQNLRQTFEAVADKLLLLYGSLEKLSPTPPLAAEASIPPTDASLLVNGESDSADDIEQRERLFELEIKGLAENARQIGDEILGIAGGFENIHDQLFNNRIENTELSDRIGNRIARPLRQLGEVRMQAVAEKVSEIDGSSSTLAAAKQQAREAITEVEALLREMQGLENYNEVIAMLRDIIRQQDQLHSKTKDQQKSKLRDLLLE